ncbi:MAG: signal recognition particle-docking protein FtsY [Anaerolineae bacterium]|nr:signal recognition particle-docking protein FtsY [Gloeobacterales cyanobacterium ES-bin-313]
MPTSVATPVVEPLKAEIPTVEALEPPPKVEINEEIFDWQKMLYGDKASTPVIEKPLETWVQTPETIVERPAEPWVEVPIPVVEKPLETVIAEVPAPFTEQPLETPEVCAPLVEPLIQVEALHDPPLLEPSVEVSEPPPVETPSQDLPSEPSPPPQPEPPAIPFWKRILGQRSFYPETPTPSAETPTSVPIAEVPPPAPIPEVPPVAPIIEAIPEPPVVVPPPPISEPDSPAESEAVPFWKRILGERPATTPTPIAPEVSPAPREKPTTEPQPAQFDVGFLWSAEVLAAQGRRPEEVTLEEISWLQKLRTGLGRTRRGLVNNLKAIVGRGPLGPQEIEELEELLLQADVGIGVSEKILESLQARVRQEALPPDQAMAFLKNQLRQQVELKGDDPAKFAPLRDQLNIWLIVGVNGVGKTTTIGKLASLASRSGYRTMIAAGDTFRAGAVSQVQIWANRSNVPVISNPSPNADPASVVFDAIGAARARNIELLIVDTAGRLQNKKNLMDELAKIRRIIDKQGAGAHVESLLVLDSTTGQNGLQQAKVFTEVASLTGVVLTKLDGSSKGGIALAIVDELKLPIRFVGVGEKVDDLRPFNSYEFIEALLSDVED